LRNICSLVERRASPRKFKNANKVPPRIGSNRPGRAARAVTRAT
jgi:hypothetical protein